MALNLTALMLNLPKPSTLSFSYPRDWGAEETNQYGAAAGGNMIGALKTYGLEALSTITPNAAQAASSNHLNLTINKRNKAIFRDLPFRQVSFSWTLRPRSLDAAERFSQTINDLKYYSAPKLIQDGSLWDTSEAIWSLEIKTTAPVPADIIFKAEEMVITDLTVDYTPNGFWSQHKDGYPTQIQLSIALMEIELAHQEKLRKGDGSGGTLV